MSTSHCPICKKALPDPNTATLSPGELRLRPFCSLRCQKIDLGNWLGERYAVPGEAAQTEPPSPDQPS